MSSGTGRRRQSSGNDFIVKGAHGLHVFKAYRFFSKPIQALTNLIRVERNSRHSLSMHVLTLLKPIQFNGGWISNYPAPVYFRRVGKDIDVLDTAGAMSDGGRYNIGGAQASTAAQRNFGHVSRKRAAIYCCESPIVVRKEYGDVDMPGSTALTYQIQIQGNIELKLVEMDAVLAAMPMLAPIVGIPSMNGTWVDIKNPAPCQILGQWLMENAPVGTHGIRFKSSHDPSVYNVCLFFRNTLECKALLQAMPLGSSAPEQS